MRAAAAKLLAVSFGQTRVYTRLVSCSEKMQEIYTYEKMQIIPTRTYEKMQHGFSVGCEWNHVRYGVRRCT
jgi:hypothetical protein